MLSAAYRDAGGPSGGFDGDHLEEVLQRVLDEAHHAWPDFDVDPIRVARRLGEAAAEREDTVVPDAEMARDVYLALGVVDEDRAALRAFDRTYFTELDAALRRMGLDEGACDEVRQATRERLLLPRDDAPPRLLAYAGGGSLRGLVKVTGVRIALNLQRGRARAEGKKQAAGRDPTPAQALDDPELLLLKGRVRDALKTAFERAVDELEPRARTLLRLHLVDGVSIDKLGELYQTHRSTAARWISRARTQVSERTRAHLEDALGAQSEDLASVLRVARSSLDLSLCRVLATRPPP